MKVTIHSSRGCELLTLSDEAKVEEAVRGAVRAFDFPAPHRYGLLLSGNTSTPLDPDRTLASYNIHEGAVLLLTITSC